MGRIAICVLAGMLLLRVKSIESQPRTQPHPPLDYQAVFKTRVPHINANIETSGAAAASTGQSSNAGSMGGTPYTVGPVVAPTTTLPEAEETIAVDPTSANGLVAVVSDFSLRGGFNTTKYSVSFANGAAGTWTENFVPLQSGMPATSDLQTWEANSDPVVAIDGVGNVYVSNLYLNASNSANGIYVSLGQLSSPDLGFSAAATVPVATDLSTTSSVIEDKEWIAVDNSSNGATRGNVYVSWTRFTGSSNMILLSRSVDHGQTWSAPIQVSDAWQNGAVQGSQVAVGSAGEVYVAYEVFYVGNLRQHFLAKSLDGGQTFGVPIAITPLFKEISFNSTYRKNSFPALAVSPTNGHVYDVYSDQPSPTTGAEVEFVASRDGGATFSSPVALNNPSKGQQFFPSVTVDSAGVIHAAWFDTRNSAKSTAIYDIYATNSSNDGVKFASNARVTPTSINAGNANFIGDYGGIAALGGFAHPVWTSGGFNSGLLQTATLQ
jgi:hypothetical protein